MSENKQKTDKSSDYGKSKYAKKHQAQDRGIFSPTSPFQSSRAHKQEAKESPTQS
jgi:hypothetical protein